MAGTEESAGTPDAPKRAARPGRAFVVPAVLCALVLAPAVAGCAGSPSAADRAETTAAPGTKAAAPGTAAATPGARAPGVGGGPDGVQEYGGLNATDIGWIQLMIAMDDRAVRVLGPAPRRSTDPDLRAWSAGLAEDLRTERAALRGLLAKAGLPDDNPHEGHDMPGMADARQLRALDGARGPRFDRLLRSALRKHLDQVVTLATSLFEADADPQVRRAARAAGAAAADARRDMPGP